MATFLKCKQEFITYTKVNEVQVNNEIKLETVFFFFKKIVPVYRNVPEIIEKYNSPINLDIVKNFSKTKHQIGNDKPLKNFHGIVFKLVDGECYWYYEDEKTRDEQFEEIASNKHLYLLKVHI